MRRIRSADGLRGLAALAVVICHTTLAAGGTRAAGADWLQVQIGEGAVMIFFVLSGLVLTLPLIDRPFEPTPYYVSRFLRLYLPVWGALLFAGVLHTAQGWHTFPGASAWLSGHDTPITLGAIVQGVTLLHVGYLWGFTTAVWTLWFEVAFSAVLPLAVFVGARAAFRLPWVSVVVLFLVLVLVNAHYLLYLPAFGVGVLIAFRLEDLRGFWQRLGTPLRGALFVAGVGMLIADWWWKNPPSPMHGQVAFETAGAAIIVTVSAVAVTASNFLTTKPCQWLGSRSYSLYLIHEPIVVTLEFITHAHILLLYAIGIPPALLGADLFYRVVEGPAHRFSQAVRRQLRERTSASVVLTEA